MADKEGEIVPKGNKSKKSKSDINVVKNAKLCDTNAVRAKKLLIQWKLWRVSGSVEATPTNLKVLFGKGGVLRLLSEAWLTRREISKFASMARALINEYRLRKIEYAINQSSQEFRDDLTQAHEELLSEIESLISSTIHEIDNLATTQTAQRGDDQHLFGLLAEYAMALRASVADLKSKMASLRAKKFGTSLLSTLCFAAAFDKDTDKDQGVVSTVVDIGFRVLAFGEGISLAGKSQDLGEQIKKLSGNKSKITKNINELEDKISARIIEFKNKKIKNIAVTFQGGYINKVGDFVEHVVKVARVYHDNKKVRRCSYTTNKVKKDVAHTLTMLVAPKIPSNPSAIPEVEAIPTRQQLNTNTIYPPAQYDQVNYYSTSQYPQ